MKQPGGLMARLQGNPNVRNPAAVAAAVERRRYGGGNVSSSQAFRGMSQSNSFRKGGKAGVPKSANKGDRFY